MKEQRVKDMEMKDEIIIPITYRIINSVFEFFKEFDYSIDEDAIDDIYIDLFSVNKEEMTASMFVTVYGNKLCCTGYREGDHRNVAPETDWEVTYFKEEFDLWCKVEDWMTIDNILMNMFKNKNDESFLDCMMDLTRSEGCD